MKNEDFIAELKESFQFFRNSTSCLSEEDSMFSPQEGLFTVAQQVGHVALTIDWFLEPLITDKGFDMDFETHEKKIRQIHSLEEAQQWFERSALQLIEFIEKQNEDFLTTPLPEGPIMGGAPRQSIVFGILDHTAHHRGALTLYSRLLGKTPKMPYGDF